MKRLQVVVLTIIATLIVVSEARAGRWLSRDPVQDGAGFVQRDPVPQTPLSFYNPSTGHRKRHLSRGNLDPAYVFVNNDAINQIDPLGLLVFLETHRIPFTPENHSFITMMVDCASKFYNNSIFFWNTTSAGYHYATIGAGPQYHLFSDDLLINGVDRPRDADRSTVNYSVAIADPYGMPDDTFIQLLLDANARYDEQAVWFFFLITIQRITITTRTDTLVAFYCLPWA
jgi:hypothetical protein